jgi:hypothetical protein
MNLSLIARYDVIAGPLPKMANLHVTRLFHAGTPAYLISTKHRTNKVMNNKLCINGQYAFYTK